MFRTRTKFDGRLFTTKPQTVEGQFGLSVFENLESGMWNVGINLKKLKVLSKRVTSALVKCQLHATLA